MRAVSTQDDVGSAVRAATMAVAVARAQIEGLLAVTLAPLALTQWYAGDLAASEAAASEGIAQPGADKDTLAYVSAMAFRLPSTRTTR